MFEREYRLLALIGHAGKINGRKKLQKIVHLLKNRGAPFHFNDRYHHYGPYSTALQAEMDYLVESNLVIEKMEQGAYTYILSEDGEELKNFLEQERDLSLPMNEQLLSKLLAESSPFLELVSTYVFLLKIGHPHEEAFEKPSELKPHLGSRLEEAVQFYEELSAQQYD